MRKIIVISVAAVFLLCLSACHTSIPEGWGVEDDTIPETDDYETDLLTEVILPPYEDEPIDEYDYYNPTADEIAAAFVNGDTEYLSSIFGENSGHGFDFIKELSFIEFEQVDRGFTYEEYEGEIYVSTVVYYYHITVEGASDNLFTAGGREWELHLMGGLNSIVQQFSPVGETVGRETFKVELPYGFNPYFCYNISNDLNIFENMSDFNLVTENPGRYISGSGGWIYYNLLICLSKIDSEYSDGYTADEFAERAERFLGITNIDKSLIFDYMDKSNTSRFAPSAHDWYGYCCNLVSAEPKESDSGNFEVVIDYYGDTGRLLFAKRIKYTLIVGYGVSRLISVECVYSNDDLILATG